MGVDWYDNGNETSKVAKGRDVKVSLVHDERYIEFLPVAASLSSIAKEVDRMNQVALELCRVPASMLGVPKGSNSILAQAASSWESIEELNAAFNRLPNLVIAGDYGQYKDHLGLRNPKIYRYMSSSSRLMGVQYAVIHRWGMHNRSPLWEEPGFCERIVRIEQETIALYGPIAKGTLS